MLTLAPELEAAPVAADAPARPTRRRLDLIAALAYLLGGVYLLGKLWTDLGNRLQRDNVQDQGFFQFVLAHGARSVTHLSNPLFDAQINVPDGVNMMANTSILGFSIPLAPITLLFGPGVTFAVLAALAPALTAISWYLVLSRHVVQSRVAAFVAGGFCGFAPGFVSQSNGHPNVAAQFMVPLILLQVTRLRNTERPVRTGLILGLMVTYQAFINEEVLLFTAVVSSLMVIVFGISRRTELRTALPRAALGLATAGGLALVLLAYPLWFQFFGPQAYHAVPQLSVTYYSDVGSYFNYATQSLAGAPSSRLTLHAHPAEENAYYGWPLLILATVIAIWLWRRLLVRAAVAVAVIFGSMSLGPRIKVFGHDLGIPGPFRLVNHVPVIESVVPVRVALFVIPALGLLIAVGLDQLIRTPRQDGAPRLLWYAAFAAALVPLFPLPLHSVVGPPVPGFVSAGTWRQYVSPGQSVVTVPLGNIGHLEAQRWSASQLLDMPIAGGYFLGPGVGPNARALYGATPRPTAQLLDDLAHTGEQPVITEVNRQQMLEDLRYWHAAVVLLGQIPRADLLRDTVRELLGVDPQFIGGAWVWDVRAMVSR